MSRVPPEQPPASEDPLREWLARMMLLINGGLDSVDNVVTSGILPTKPDLGKIYIFPNPIPPEIAYGGPWMYLGNGIWRPMIAMYNRGLYVNGLTYYPQDVVHGNGWTMSANTLTEDYPFPQATGPNELTPDPDPTFVEQSHNGVVRSGMEIEFTQAGFFTQLDVWVTEITPDTTYIGYVIDITDPASPITTTLPLPNLVINQWNTITLGSGLVVTGKKYLILIDAINSGSETTWQYPWTREADSNNNQPALGNWLRDNANTRLRINKEDGDGIDHTLELQVIVGTRFLITQLDDPDKSYTYYVNAPYTDLGASYEYPVTLESTGSAGAPDVGAGCQIRASQPVPAATKYAEEVGYWPTNQPSYATVQGVLHTSGVIQTVTDNAYGVRIGFTPATISDDWDFIAYSTDVT